ncbi:MAG: transposase family protein, partial [Acidobacteria bacterium]|nr:transposase family protein [Acidobacteriota bacterium]
PCAIVRDLGRAMEQATQALVRILKLKIRVPAPDRKRRSWWKTFLEAHCDVLASIDFTTFEAWTKAGLVAYYLLFVLEIATRRVHFSGCTANPDEPWMVRIARNLSDPEDGFLRPKKFLIMDRDAKFCEEFRATIEQVGIEAVRLPPRSPNLTPHIERFRRSLKDECLHRLICFGQKPPDLVWR